MSAIGISSHLFWQALASSSSVHAENVSPMIVVVGYAGNLSVETINSRDSRVDVFELFLLRCFSKDSAIVAA